MNEMSQQLVAAILRLPPEECADAVDQLIVRLYDSTHPQAASAQAAELAERENEDDSGDVAWEDLNSELIEKYGP